MKHSEKKIFFALIYWMVVICGQVKVANLIKCTKINLFLLVTIGLLLRPRMLKLTYSPWKKFFKNLDWNFFNTFKFYQKRELCSKICHAIETRKNFFVQFGNLIKNLLFMWRCFWFITTFGLGKHFFLISKYFYLIFQVCVNMKIPRIIFIFNNSPHFTLHSIFLQSIEIWKYS